MNDNDITGDLGPQPEPETEPGETPPGGVDAHDVPEEDEHTNLVPDLPASANPATEDVPAETQELEDTSTAATRTEGGQEEGADAEGGEDAPV